MGLWRDPETHLRHSVQIASSCRRYGASIGGSGGTRRCVGQGQDRLELAMSLSTSEVSLGGGAQKLRRGRDLAHFLVARSRKKGLHVGPRVHDRCSLTVQDLIFGDAQLMQR